MGSIGSMGGDRAGQLEIEGWAEIMREIERQVKNRQKFSVKSAKSWLNHEREIVKGERSRVKRRKKEREVGELLTVAERIPIKTVTGEPRNLACLCLSSVGPQPYAPSPPCASFCLSVAPCDSLQHWPCLVRPIHSRIPRMHVSQKRISHAWSTK